MNFDGNCKEAVKFYADVFGTIPGKTMTYSEMPGDSQYMKSEYADKIMYTDLQIAGTTVMFSDVPWDTKHTAGTNIVMSPGSTDEDEVRRWFNGLQAGGQVIMPLGETFFSKLYGMVIDKYGICWNVTCSGE